MYTYVTWPDLVQIGILIVGIIGLFLQAKKSDRRHPEKVRRSLLKLLKG